MKNFEMQLNHLIRQKGDTTFETVSAIGEQLQVKHISVQGVTANFRDIILTKKCADFNSREIGTNDFEQSMP